MVNIMDTETGVDVVIAIKSDDGNCVQSKEEKYVNSDIDSEVNNTYANPTFVGEGSVIRVLPEHDIAVITTQSNSNDDADSNTAKHVYGWQCITPNVLQVFNTPLVFLICLCSGVIAQGLVVSGISLASLTAIEKQFGLKSSEVAIFTTAYDTAYGVCSLFIGYVGTFHKPRYLGWGLLIMVFGAVIVSLPKFIIMPYKAGADQFDDFCNNNGTNEKDDSCTSSKGWYQLIFNLGYIILGFGATPLYTLGPAHIDEVTSIGQSSVYLGFFYAASAIGPAIGFIIAIPVLETWVELSIPPNSLTPSDSKWVGAWWVGFLIGAGLLLIPIIPMLGLPRLFPNTEEVRAKKRQISDHVPANEELKFGWPATKALLKNPPFMFISLAIAAESLAIGGFSTFISKFVETQFYLTASDAALYTGVMGIPGAAGGVLLGGYLVKRYKWGCKDILKRATVMSFIAALCSSFILVGCHTNDQDRSTTVYNNTCNLSCNCNLRYRPICTFQDDTTYYSPCNAGCQAGDKLNKTTFTNCACFPRNITHATNGRCTPDSCPLFPLFVVGIFFIVLFTFLNNVPLINASFRIVNDGQGSFAMGFQQIFIRFLGFIPSPIMYGSLIDKSCVLWQNNKCNDKTANCLEYNNAYFRFYMFILALGTKFLAFIFMLLAYKLYKPPPNRTTPVESGVDNVSYSAEQSSR